MVIPYFQDERVTLYCADLREVLPELGRVDHTIVDPPYSCDVYVRARGKDTTGKGFKHRPGLKAIRSGELGSLEETIHFAAGQFSRISKGWTIIFSDVLGGWKWYEACTAAGLRLMRHGIWDITNPTPQMSGDRPGQAFELISIFHPKGKASWNGGGRGAKWAFPNTAVEKRRSERTRRHPCPKPLKLMQSLILDFTHPGDVLLDCYAGSGTLGIAAINTGRRAVLVEKEERYCAGFVGALRQRELFREPRPEPRPEPEQVPIPYFPPLAH
jgi:site-specific DNA-methyltransferase (adenine-specific)